MISIRRVGRIAPVTLAALLAALANGCNTDASRPTGVGVDSATPSRAIIASGSGLVAAYGFDETSGSATTDASGNGNNGTMGSGVARTTSGRFGGALTFNGSNGLVTIPDAASLRLTQSMTLEAWVNPSTVTQSWRDVVYKGDDNYYLMATSTMYSNVAGGASFGNTSSTVEAYGTSPIAPNTWTHLAVTYDGATIRLYVNGSQVSTRSRTGSFTTSSNPLQIGGNLFYGQYFAGRIDEVRVYNRPLSASEIQTDMNTAVSNTVGSGTSGGSTQPVASALAIQTQPGSATSGVPFAIQPVVRIVDGAGSVVSTSTASVTAAIASGTGSLTGTTTVSAVNGVASFTNLAITGSGNFSLKFTSGTLPAVTSNVFAVSAPVVASASQLTITVQPSATAPSGVAFAQQPSVQLRNASGVAVAQSGVAVTAAIASGGGTLGGTVTATTNASGVATFSNLSITGTTGSRTLRFSSGSLIAATSNAIAVSAPAAATQLTITTQPSASATSGVAFAQQPAVQLRDASNNAIAQGGVAVTAAIATGTGTLGGTTAATTNSNGVATFSGLSITGSGSSTLRFSATGLTSATSATVSVTSSTTGSGSASGPFAPANILSNASFETGFEGFTNGAGGTPTTVRDNTLAAPGGGSFSIKEAWSPNPGGDAGTSTFYDFLNNPQDHMWVRFYVRATAPITSIMKFMRYDSAPGRNTHLGGLFMGQGSNIFMFGSDLENGAATSTICLNQAQVLDGNWHSIEFEYWRNGDPSGFPSAAFWFDGNVQACPNGNKDVTYAQYGQNASFWLNGRLNIGQRNNSEKLGSIEWLSTLNAGNTTTGQVNIDRIAISTAGRIGP